MMLDERADRGLTEIESYNVDFLKNGFLNKAELRKSFELYEMEKYLNSLQNLLAKVGNKSSN